jgi:thiol:disulfide interchange protein DsbC
MRRRLYSYRIAVFVLVLTMSLCVNPAFAAKSDNISKDQAREVLKRVLPDVKVISIEKAVVAGLWEVVIQSRGQNGIVYLDKDAKHIIFGSIVESATQTNLTKLKFDEINKVDFSSIPLDDAIVMGNKNAKHKVVVFDDPD